MRQPEPLRRWYDLTFETLTPVHISLGPESVLIPDEDCDLSADGAATYVVDRLALMAEFQSNPPLPPAPAPAPAARTYRDVLTDERVDVMQRQLLLAALRSNKDAKPDDPVPAYLLGDDEAPQRAPSAGSAGIDWDNIGTVRPRDLPSAEKRWRTADGAHLIRYMLDGTPRVPGNNGDQWWESISRLPRTPDDAILIPGSGIKGALRSILAYAMTEQIGAANLPRPTPGNPRFAAQPLEQRTLAPEAPRGNDGRPRNTPNYDAGRLLLPHDCPLDAGTQARIMPFGILSTHHWRTFQAGTPEGAAAVEAIPPGVKFGSRFAIDAFLLDQWADRRGMGIPTSSPEVFAAFRSVLTDDLSPLLAAGRSFARAVLEQDRHFYAADVPPTLPGGGPRRRTGELLARIQSLQPNQTIFQLGWGTGRAGKTPYRMAIHDWLVGSPDEKLSPIEREVRDASAGSRSRRLTVAPNGQPDMPFGWVVCTVTPRA